MKGSKGKNIFLKYFPFILIICGLLGLFASFTLTMEKFALLEDPSAQISCDINPILSCGSVIKTNQAEAFGFPNPFIGLAGFSVVITIGVGLLAGAKFKKWFWLGLNTGSALAFIFIHWLIYQSLYSIGALCLYCMLTWTITWPIVWYTTLYNIHEKNLVLPNRLKGLKQFFLSYHLEILITWYILIVLAILNRFWYYWSTLI